MGGYLLWRITGKKDVGPREPTEEIKRRIDGGQEVTTRGMRRLLLRHRAISQTHSSTYPSLKPPADVSIVPIARVPVDHARNNYKQEKIGAVGRLVEIIPLAWTVCRRPPAIGVRSFPGLEVIGGEEGDRGGMIGLGFQPATLLLEEERCV